MKGGGKARRRKLAINRLRNRLQALIIEGLPVEGAIERFFARQRLSHRGRRSLHLRGAGQRRRGRLAAASGGRPARNLPLRRISGTDLWYVVIEIPADSRVEYQFELRRDGQWHRFNDPANPRIARSPMGDSSICFSQGYRVPDWALFDPEARSGELVEWTVHSQAQRRDNRVTVYLPARYTTRSAYPLLIVHDGGDYLEYSSMKIVLDNLIHRLDMAETVVAFTYPGERLTEYPNSAAHARWIAHELLGELQARLPLIDQPSARCLMGSSFGARGVTVHGGALSGDLRVVAAAVRIVRVHRHRRRSRRGATRSIRWSSSSTAIAPGRSGWPTGCSSPAGSMRT